MRKVWTTPRNSVAEMVMKGSDVVGALEVGAIGGVTETILGGVGSVGSSLCFVCGGTGGRGNRGSGINSLRRCKLCGNLWRTRLGLK